MERWFQFLTKHGSALRALGIVLVLVSLAVFLYADFRFEPTRASAWFQGEAVILAVLALIAAALAAVFTFPAYRDWWMAQQRQPDLTLRVEVGLGQLESPVLVPDGDLLVVSGRQADLRVRVAVLNEGDGTLLGGVLNICVLSECSIEVLDDPRVMHYALPGTAQNGVISPGEVERVRATSARDTFPPGARMFHVQVKQPIGRPMPLAVVLSGDGMTTPITSRITVQVDKP